LHTGNLSRHARVLLVGAVPLGARAGCGQGDDKIYVSGFTDSHGRACTFAFTSQEGRGTNPHDVDVSQLDCEPPPEGEEPGDETTVEVESP
jgi:hypothetical protein